MNELNVCDVCFNEIEIDDEECQFCIEIEKQTIWIDHQIELMKENKMLKGE